VTQYFVIGPITSADYNYNRTDFLLGTELLIKLVYTSARFTNNAVT